ncbi:MAG: phosphate/phosphonate ABC transporter permease [Treponema sp.]|jgi:phosphonate transport system permease protein|nr:phosphate/phosphonate ABC transporter permease [Treponema sp.]
MPSGLPRRFVYKTRSVNRDFCGIKHHKDLQTQPAAGGIAESGGERLPPVPWPKKFGLGILAAGALVFVFAYPGIDVPEAARGLPEFFLFFVRNFLPPNFKRLNVYAPLILQTIFFAVMGTYISSIVGFAMGLLLSEKTNPVRPLRMVTMFVLSIMRNVPFLVWASLMVYVFGIGNIVGLLALIFTILGFLSRSYAESISEIADSKLEALRATGASNFQILVHGLIPEFVPAWLNWTLFSFEIGIRASAVLGMVGAGGIGIMIQTNMRLSRYREAFSLVLVLIVMILLTELAVNRLRKLIK